MTERVDHHEEAGLGARFHGERLREVRVIRGLTATALAEKVDVSPASITQYERHDRAPRPTVVSALARALDVPETHFHLPPVEETPGPRRFRSFSAATKSARSSVAERVRWLGEIVRYVERFVDLPAVNLPDLKVGDPLRLGLDDIEELAGEVRRAWGLGQGPIPNMVGLLEARGVCVARFSFFAPAIDGVSTVEGGRPLVALNTEAASAVRSRFDAAHELAHVVAHGQAPAAPTSDVHKVLEQQAHRFAGAFLFPRASYMSEVYALHPEALVHTKRKWGCSMALMIRRARDLRLVSEDQYEHAFRRMSISGYRKREPLDDTLPVERPSMLWKAIELIATHRLATVPEVLSALPGNEADVRTLVDARPGVFAPPPADEPEVRIASHAQGRVLAFQRSKGKDPS